MIVNNSTNSQEICNILSPQLIKHKKTTTYDVGNPGPGLEKAQICSEDKAVNEILCCLI